MKNWYTENCKWLLPTITFLLGIITTSLISYFAFISRLDSIEFKVDLLHETYKAETKNIYDVFHTQHVRISEIDTLLTKAGE